MGVCLTAVWMSPLDVSNGTVSPLSPNPTPPPPIKTLRPLCALLRGTESVSEVGELLFFFRVLSDFPVLTCSLTLTLDP